VAGVVVGVVLALAARLVKNHRSSVFGTSVFVAGVPTVLVELAGLEVEVDGSDGSNNLSLLEPNADASVCMSVVFDFWSRLASLNNFAASLSVIVS